MWVALLTVAVLSLLVSFALAAIATYLYFFASGTNSDDQTGVPCTAPNDSADSTNKKSPAG
jgi:hypothetical protein